MLIVLLLQCGDWCRKHCPNPQDVVHAPVDEEEGKIGGVMEKVEQTADNLGRNTGY